MWNVDFCNDPHDSCVLGSAFMSSPFYLENTAKIKKNVNVTKVPNIFE